MSNNNVIIYVRKRPLLQKEINNNEKDIIDIKSNKLLTLNETKLDLMSCKKNKEHNYIFDRIFDTNSTNQHIYNNILKNDINKLLEGTSILSFSYGATGSGKTHTIIGTKDEPGLYQLSMQDILNKIKYTNYRLSITCFEIYNNQIYDIFNNKNKLNGYENSYGSYIIPNLVEKKIHNIDNFITQLEIYMKYRTIEETNNNDQSSRSHTIFNIILRNQNKMSKLIFVDLAGNERGMSRGKIDNKIYKESVEINKSLFAVKECIRALFNNSSHIPFRGSTITRILKDAFTNKYKTNIFSTITPSNKRCKDVIDTLLYINYIKNYRYDSKYQNRFPIQKINKYPMLPKQPRYQNNIRNKRPPLQRPQYQQRPPPPQQTQQTQQTQRPRQPQRPSRQSIQSPNLNNRQITNRSLNQNNSQIIHQLSNENNKITYREIPNEVNVNPYYSSPNANQDSLLPTLSTILKESNPIIKNNQSRNNSRTHQPSESSKKAQQTLCETFHNEYTNFNSNMPIMNITDFIKYYDKYILKNCSFNHKEIRISYKLKKKKISIKNCKKELELILNQRLFEINIIKDKLNKIK